LAAKERIGRCASRPACFAKELGGEYVAIFFTNARYGNNLGKPSLFSPLFPVAASLSAAAGFAGEKLNETLVGREGALSYLGPHQ
jgi:hypothetical protein